MRFGRARHIMPNRLRGSWSLSMAVFETWAARHPACGLLAVFAISLTLRLVLLSRLPPGLIYPDEDAYLDMGSRIAAGHGHSQSFSLFDYIERERPSAYWNFLFPLLVAGYRVAFSEHLALYRFAQVIIAATLPMCVLVLGYRLFDNARVAWLAALACCFYPHLVYFSPLLVTEPVFLALLYLAFALLFGVASEARWRVGAHALVGIILALSCLVRSLTLYVLPVLAAWSVVKHRRCA